MMGVKCYICGYDACEGMIENHHLFPKFMNEESEKKDISDKYGRIYLCKFPYPNKLSCHDKLHKQIPNYWQWKRLTEKEKQEWKMKIVDFSLNWIEYEKCVMNGVNDDRLNSEAVDES
jgi:hypothetical protein